MDHFETALPQLQVKNKMVSRQGQLLVTLTRMITHGHGDKTFMQYFNELWPNELSFTIGLFLRLFHILEKEPVRESQILFEFEPQNTFFQQILQGSSCYLNALKPADQIVGVKPLLRKLLLQMDNCVQDNRNHHLFIFLSLLIAYEILEEVQLGFLIVEHAHEDIDKSFGYLSKKLKQQNNYVMVDSMKVFMFSQDRPLIMQFIQEIPDFKSQVNGYLNDGLNVLVNHTKIQFFMFFCG